MQVKYETITEANSVLVVRMSRELIYEPSQAQSWALLIGMEFAVQQLLADPFYTLSDAATLTKTLQGFRASVEQRGWTSPADCVQPDAAEICAVMMQIRDPELCESEMHEARQNMPQVYPQEIEKPRRSGLMLGFGALRHHPPHELLGSAYLSFLLMQTVCDSRLMRAVLCVRESSPEEYKILHPALERQLQAKTQ